MSILRGSREWGGKDIYARGKGRTAAGDDEGVALIEVFGLADEDDDDFALEAELLEHHLVLGEGALQSWM